MIRELPRSHEILDALNRAKRSPLMLACQAGNLEAVKMLIEYKANYRLTTETGTPLIMAVEADSISLMEYLLSLKDSHSLNDSDLSGLTPLYVACYNHKMEALKYILGHN